MKLSRIAPIVGIVGIAAACTVVVIADVTVQWSVDGKSSGDDKCKEYGIDSWNIVLDGPERPMPTFRVPCGLEYSISDSIEEGRYDIQVSAEDADGNLLASKSKTGVFIDGMARSNIFEFDFVAADFELPPAPVCGDGTCEVDEVCPADCDPGPSCGDGTCDPDEDFGNCPADCEEPKDASIIVSWKINGTIDGTATGDSWDKCDEVGAAKVKITIGSDAPVIVPCADDNMSTQIMGFLAGEYDLKIILLDASDNPITTEAGDKVIAAKDPQEEPFEFYYDSFNSTIKETTTGDYLFRTFFEAAKLKCGETSPAVGYKLHLLELDGTPVNAQACYPGPSHCVDTISSDSGICQDFDQSIADLNWGSYILRISAGPSGGTDLCWMTDNGKDDTGKIDILVGAGQVNPIVEQILDRISTAGDCAP